MYDLISTLRPTQEQYFKSLSKEDFIEHLKVTHTSFTTQRMVVNGQGCDIITPVYSTLKPRIFRNDGSQV